MTTIHPTALVASPPVGEGTRIWAWVNVLPGATIGRDCKIGDRVTVKCGVSLYDGIILEDDAFVGPDVSFPNDARPRSGQRPETFPKTRIRTGASLGAGSIVLPGLSVGRWAMIGAGALVTRDVPDFALVYGSPARVHGHVCRCGQSLRFNDRKAACVCGRRYELQPDESIAEIPAS